MSATSALQFREVVDQVRRVLAVELLSGAEAAEYVDETLAHGAGTTAAYETVRDVVPPLSGDRPLDADIDAIVDIINSGALLDQLETALGDGFASVTDES